MSEKEEPDESAGRFDAEGNYIIEDTGETLEDFDAEEAAARLRSSSEGGGSDVEALRNENQELRDKYMRKLAEFENFRKRVEREKAEFYRYALTDVMRDLVPVVDNLERALATETTGSEFRKGVELIYKQLSEVLQKHGLKVIGESNVPFDPQVHEAVMREESTDVPSHTVTELLQKGYNLHDRLIRPAMVKVAVGGPERAESLTKEP